MTPASPTTSDATIPLDQPADPTVVAPSQAALDQPDLGGGILQQQAADAAVKFDPAPDPDPLIAPDPNAEQFPGVDTNVLNLTGAITQETILRLDILRLAGAQNESPDDVVTRAAAYRKWMNENV